MNITELRYLVAIRKWGSVSAAAKQLYAAQPNVSKALKNLERALKLQADTIAKKYILPPLTADFAIMFLPLEGLYAETLKIPGLSEYFASRRIMACGPTHFGALLTTLQIGYKTAAIEKRSVELWELISAFQHEFGNCVKILYKTQNKLH